MRQNGYKRDQYLRQALFLLPPGNRSMVKALIGLLVKVVSHSSINKMHSSNLAIVFAPSVIREQNETAASAMMGMRLCTELVEYLIDNYSKLLEPSSATTSAESIPLLVEGGPASASGGAAAAHGIPSLLIGGNAPAEEETFTRVLRRGTMRLGSRMMMEQLA